MRITALLSLSVPLATGLFGCDLAETPQGIVGPATPHPCFGNRTDTVWLDDADTAYVGCGTTTEGTGLYRTTNAGSSWEEVPGFDTFRVTHVHRAGDGVLYVAGTSQTGDRVVSLDASDTLTTVFASASQTWNSFHVGTFLRLDDGSAIAESLTGSDLAFRPSDTDDWQDGYGWWTGSDSFQVLDAVVHRGRVHAVGSTIIQPPQVFVQTDDPGFVMSDTALGQFDGELWSIDSDGDNLVAGGVNQQNDDGMVFVNQGDPTNAGSWAPFDLSSLFPEDATWIRGTCRDGPHVVAVGEFSMLGDGLMIESTDSGATWIDVTPSEAPPLSRCRFAHGRLVVAGAEGFFAID